MQVQTPGPGPEQPPRPAQADPRDEACRILLKLESPESRARELLSEAQAQLPFGPPDAALLLELVYGCLRQRGLLDQRLAAVSHRPLELLSPWVRNLLRLSVYQILFLERIPEAAAVDAAGDIARRHGHEGVVKFVNGCLRELCRLKAEGKLPPLPAHPVRRLAVESSHPLWMAERLCELAGWEQAAACLQASNQPAPLTLRANPARLSRQELLERLRAAGLAAEACRFSPWGLRLPPGSELRGLPGQAQGDFQTQDESAQLAVLLLDPRPGWQVADVCAAPGGKAGLIAQLLGAEGRLWAFDRKPASLERLLPGLRRLSPADVQGEVRDAASPRQDLLGSLDAVLVDAPSSSLGVLRRRPEARWQARPEASAGLAERQLKLLQASAAYLKVGGILLYTTATWEEAENEAVVARFLERHPGFAFERAGALLPYEVCSREGFLKVWPGSEGMDGCFAARLRRDA